jgi:DNA ligase (NAD+)
MLHVGQEYAQFLAQHYSSIDELGEASEETLSGLPSIGPKIAQSIVAFFRQDSNREILRKLRDAGVVLRREEEASQAEEQRFSGMTFVFTGRMNSFTRPEPRHW